MYIKDRYDSLGQRIAAYFRILLKPFFGPVKGASLSCYEDIHNFFNSLYLMFYEQPGLFGIPLKPDLCMDDCHTPDIKKAYLKDFMQIFKIYEAILKFLYQVGCNGEMNGYTLVIKPELLRKFLHHSARIKKQLVSGLSLVGVEIKETDRGVEISNNNTPGMIEGLRLLSSVCSEDPSQNGFFHFYRCDFDVTNKNYGKMNNRIFTEITRDDVSYRSVQKLWKYMEQSRYHYKMDVKDTFRIVQSYTCFRIKRTPLLKFSFDIRYKTMIRVSFHFVSTNKIVPLLEDAPLFLRNNFFEISTSCQGNQCPRKNSLHGNNKPALLKFEDRQKTICWLLQAEYTDLNEQNCRLILNYLLLHQRLLTG